MQLTTWHLFTATSSIIGTKSQWFPSPLSTSIDSDTLIVMSSFLMLALTTLFTTIYLHFDILFVCVQRTKCFGFFFHELRIQFFMETILHQKKRNFIAKTFHDVKNACMQFVFYLVKNWAQFKQLKNWFFARDPSKLSYFSMLFSSSSFMCAIHFSMFYSDCDSCLQEISHFK